MRGGMVRWKRGIQGQGVKQALAYALDGSCDATLTPTRLADGVEAAVAYAPRRAHRSTVDGDTITIDALDADQLATWIDGHDPETNEPRGTQNPKPEADLLLDATINAPKTFSIAALMDPDISAAFDALQDRIRDRTLLLWRAELNARRGKAGAFREPLSRIEVVELRHERSRSLDPHRHRHLWLNVKVLGEDGRWSGIDSRVAMRFQNVINAEGELANRTDPEWLNALAAKGYTLDEHGEIAQLAGLVHPLSRRSNQIEANRAKKLAEWRTEHPDLEPTPQDLTAIDQWAWAHERPNKPGAVNEAEWRQAVLAEIQELSPQNRPASARLHPVDAERLDLSLLARVAVNDADRRSAGCGGRFSLFDVRAGVLRALAGSGIVTDRMNCDALVDDIQKLVLTDHVQDLLTNDSSPPHVKSLMASATVRVKSDLTATLDRISREGHPLADDAIESTVPLDAGQRAAAAAIAGTDRLVAVVGPAGAGKTAMLKSAITALHRAGRRSVVVAPTRKAAGVAGRESGADATSVHAVLRDHGWIAGEDRAGAVVWRQLRPGDRTPTGAIYRGPGRYQLRPGDRIVVDEAGMVDLHAARALAIVAEQTGAGIAMIGDPRQISPVGHYGAMTLLRRAATRSVELGDVHRFRLADGSPDTAYAALSLRVREPRNEEDALDVARHLLERGQILSVESLPGARLAMADAYARTSAAGSALSIIVATNEEASAVSELIQRERVTRGDLSPSLEAKGRDGQRLLAGDIVQTRRNDRDEGVDNRQLWRIERIRRDGRLVLISPDDQHRRRTVSANYAARDVHLAYATTAHGAQGETTDAAIVGPDVDAAGFYVGMTRGRTSNTFITTASTTEKVLEQLAQTLLRGRGEHTLEDNRRAAAAELAAAAKEAPAARDDQNSPSGHGAEPPNIDTMPPLPPDEVIASIAAELDIDERHGPPPADHMGDWDEVFTAPVARAPGMHR